jgi:hypothetical protein
VCSGMDERARQGKRGVRRWFALFIGAAAGRGRGREMGGGEGCHVAA